jgi:NAD(P)-dependent dehydrogenase (short-subunit alcohol dehydrogenase family)
MGRSVVVLGRNPSALEAVSAQIRASTGNDAVGVLHADLSSLDSVRGAADRFLAEHDRLDVLVNNAGVMLMHRSVTADGFERTFAVNHLAPFLLTNLLLDVLERTAPSRVVNVTSTGFRRGRIDFADLQAARRFDGMQAYYDSKLAGVLFTYELARRLAGSGVTANCVHPGVVRTNIGHGERLPLAFGVGGGGEPAVHADARAGRAHERVRGHGGGTRSRLGPVLRQRAGGPHQQSIV